MTTIITIIVAIALLAALGKIFSKSSSGLQGQQEAPLDTGEPASSPEKSKKNSPAVKKERKMFSNKAIKGESLFHAPPEPPLFTGRKETQQLILARDYTPSHFNRSQWVPGSRENLLGHHLDQQIRPTISR